jgi:hypothetical protein
LAAALNSIMITPLALVRMEEQNNLFFVTIKVFRTGHCSPYKEEKLSAKVVAERV